MSHRAVLSHLYLFADCILGWEVVSVRLHDNSLALVCAFKSRVDIHWWWSLWDRYPCFWTDIRNSSLPSITLLVSVVAESWTAEKVLLLSWLPVAFGPTFFAIITCNNLLGLFLFCVTVRAFSFGWLCLPCPAYMIRRSPSSRHAAVAFVAW